MTTDTTYTLELTKEELYLIRSALSEATSVWYKRKREARESLTPEHNTDVCTDIINEYGDVLDRLDTFT